MVLRVPWTVRRLKQSIQRKSTLNIYCKDWCWSSSSLATWWEEPTHWKRPWCWERLRERGEGDDRGWDGWMVSLTQCTWIWANSRRQWRTEKPGVLQSMGSQRVGHNYATEQQLGPLSLVKLQNTRHFYDFWLHTHHKYKIIQGLVGKYNILIKGWDLED